MRHHPDHPPFTTSSALPSCFNNLSAKHRVERIQLWSFVLEFCVGRLSVRFVAVVEVKWTLRMMTSTTRRHIPTTKRRRRIQKYGDKLKEEIRHHHYYLSDCSECLVRRKFMMFVFANIDVVVATDDVGLCGYTMRCHMDRHGRRLLTFRFCCLILFLGSCFTSLHFQFHFDFSAYK